MTAENNFMEDLLTREQEDKLEALIRPRLPKETSNDFPTVSEMRADKEHDNPIDVALQGLQALILMCGDDYRRDGLQETPFRVLKAFLEYTEGYGEDPKQHLLKDFEANVNGRDIVLIKDIPFNSMCEHHFAPFFGTASIAYIPSNKIAGLSKFARTLDGYAKRFQVQEKLTTEVIDAIEDVLQPIGSAVIINAEHYCMCGRGAHKRGATTTTSAVRGVFAANASAKQELLSLLSMK